jgi:hypothetical protein
MTLMTHDVSPRSHHLRSITLALHHPFVLRVPVLAQGQSEDLDGIIAKLFAHLLTLLTPHNHFTLFARTKRYVDSESCAKEEAAI